MSRLGCVLLLFFVAVIGGFRVDREAGWPGGEMPAARQPPQAGLIIPVAGHPAGHPHRHLGAGPRGGRARAPRHRHRRAPRHACRGCGGRHGRKDLREQRRRPHRLCPSGRSGAWIDYYAHLDTYAPDLREGVPVRSGQRLGSVGSSGNADPGAPHLHYEIKRMAAGEKWWQGTEVNPYPLLEGGQ